ncbi:MAG TPA: DUF3667 domain-containing protein [Longimicrobium sp.]|jgi:hypothetical protein|uniref:DUF3667 domain-containing protein n=1 Tax=Longimicrobium sp. TaxID=2029185 RepID=UPI002EDA4C3A
MHEPPSTIAAPQPTDGLPAEAGGAACENCGTVLAGRYCHACGQAAERPTTTVRGFARHAAADLTSLDSRILRTLALLLARPGRLTREYLDGRRIRYTQPLQVYLGAAAAFFFVNAYHPFFRFDPRTGNVVSALNAAGVSGSMGQEARARIAVRGISLEVFSERFTSTVTSYLPALLVGSVLLFALVLHLFHRRPRRGFVEHAVFALHWSAFYLLLMIVERFFPDRRGASPGVLNMAIMAVAAVYLALALRRVYGQSWLMTAGKALGLFLVYQALLGLWMVSAIAAAFRVLL